jgi:hypothetical protein
MKVKLETCILEVLGSSLGRDSGNADYFLSVSQFLLAISGYFLDQSTIASFQILSANY